MRNSISRAYAERVASVHLITDRVKARKLTAFTSRLRVPQALRNLASMPLTVAAAGCFAAATLLVSLPGGLAVTGVVLVALEYLAADAE